VYKRPKTETGVALHDIELKYYRTYGSNCGNAFAKLLGYASASKTMQLEKIKGQTCQAFIDSKPEAAKLAAANRLIKKFEKSIEPIHSHKIGNLQDSDEDIALAIQSEFIDAVIKRVKPCNDLISNVVEQNHIVSIDGMPITKNFNDILAMLETWVSSKLKESYFTIGLTHGDPNTDNTMLDKTGIRFIDPRGYFGDLKTLGLGVQQYDLAKFVYGFSGYSRFNKAEFIASNIEDGDLKIFICPKEVQGITDVSIFDMNVSDDIKILVGIIWMKLTSYIINDPMKSVAAYLYGNAIITKLLTK
jgi:hypothetical protein